MGITSTNTFCRPSCPNQTPKRSSLKFFSHAAAAIGQGFRACRRCRPEVAPRNPEWSRRGDLPAKAVAAVERGVADRLGISGLANELGVGSRQLREELKSAIGVTPRQLVATRRLWLAQVLLEQTELPVSDVGFASGFASSRRFNELFQSAFARSAGEYRAQFHVATDLENSSLSAATARTFPGISDEPPLTQTTHTSHRFEIRLPSCGRLRWDFLLDFFAVHAISGLEFVGGRTYRRRFPGGWVELYGSNADDTLNIRCGMNRMELLATLLTSARRLVDLDADLFQIGRSFHDDPHLGHLAQQGVPPIPGCLDGFEVAVRTIVGQQISVAGAQTLLNRIVATSSKTTATLESAPKPAPNEANPGQLYDSFPTPTALLAADLEQVGLTRKRCQVLRKLAEAVESGEICLAPGVDSHDMQERLQSISGIGPWTAGYIAMRALGDPNGWPENDLVVRKVTGLSPVELRAASQAWQPWRAYATLLLWSKRRN